MIVTCEGCKKVYDDAKRWTLCPHEALPTKAEKAEFLEAVANSDECPLCKMKKPDHVEGCPGPHLMP